MTPVLAATLLTLLCLYAGAKSRYFVVGALTEARIENNSRGHVMSSTPETYGARAGPSDYNSVSTPGGALLRPLGDELFGNVHNCPGKHDFVARNFALIGDVELHSLKVEMLNKGYIIPINRSHVDSPLTQVRLRGAGEFGAFHFERVGVGLGAYLRLERCCPRARDVSAKRGDRHRESGCQTKYRPDHRDLLITATRSCYRRPSHGSNQSRTNE